MHVLVPVDGLTLPTHAAYALENSACHFDHCLGGPLPLWPGRAVHCRYTSRCLMAFQEQDGFDVCLFAVYLQVRTLRAVGPSRAALSACMQ